MERTLVPPSLSTMSRRPKKSFLVLAALVAWCALFVSCASVRSGWPPPQYAPADLACAQCHADRTTDRAELAMLCTGRN